MKTIKEVTDGDKNIMVSVLETVDMKSLSTIKDIRAIDKLCTVIYGSSGDSIAFEDADFDYLKHKIETFSGWVPKARKEILALFEKIGEAA